MRITGLEPVLSRRFVAYRSIHWAIPAQFSSKKLESNQLSLGASLPSMMSLSQWGTTFRFTLLPVGEEGFEPTQTEANGFTVRPSSPNSGVPLYAHREIRTHISLIKSQVF